MTVLLLRKSLMFPPSIDPIFLRSLSTSLAQPQSRKMKEYNKRDRDRRTQEELWRRQKKMNPFVGNVGMARQLKSLNLDKDDPTFKTEDFTELFQEFDGTMEGMKERSKAYRDKYKADEAERKRIEKRRIIEKKVYPKPTNPNLLTWMEKEMIRYLHKMDPEEWSYDRLAESFPATTGVIHKVLRAKTLTDQKMIREYNKEVNTNWRLLSRGKLDIDPAYEDHLKSGYKNLQISSGLKNLAEQEIMMNLEKLSNGLPKPAIPGEFAKIIIDYKNKLSKDKEDTPSLAETDVIDVPNLFSENTIPGTPLLNEVSPYAETALITTNIDLSKEPRMDMERFRKKYLNEERKSTRKVDQEENPNPLREKYLAWARAEERKSKLAAKIVKKIEPAVITDIESEGSGPHQPAQPETAFEVKRSESGETFIFDPDQGYHRLDVKNRTPDFIEIDPKLKTKFKFFQIDDSVYDRDGYLLYRIPGLG